MTETRRKPIAAAATMGRMMGDYFRELDEASRSGIHKVA